MKNLMLALVAIAFSGTAFAAAVKKPLTVKQQIAKVNREAVACNKKNNSEMQMKMCAGTYADESQQIVDDLVASITKSLSSSDDDYSKETLKRLQASQAAWVAFRDADASLAGAQDLGGTNESLDISSELGDLAQKRALELDAQFNSAK